MGANQRQLQARSVNFTSEARPFHCYLLLAYQPSFFVYLSCAAPGPVFSSEYNNKALIARLQHFSLQVVQNAGLQPFQPSAERLPGGRGSSTLLGNGSVLLD